MTKAATLAIAIIANIAPLAVFPPPAEAALGAPGSDSVRRDQWHLRYLRSTDANSISDGAGVTVAVLDTGVDQHPDLHRNLLPGRNFTPGKGGDSYVDQDSHGTSMAGLIAAHGSGSQSGALGIAPAAKILPVKFKIKNNAGNPEDLAAAVEWATSNGADIINISAVSGTTIRLKAALRAAIQSDVVVVASAGNRPEDSGVSYPALEDKVVAVGGIDQHGNHADISVTGKRIDITAPAVDIYSTSTGGKYSKGTGTSSATAIVAGAAALVRSKYPHLPAAEVVHRLTATAVDKGPPGRDDQYGYGVIDLVAALTADVPPLGFEGATATPPGGATSAAAQPAGGDGDGGAAVRGWVTLGVIVAAGGGFLVWRRRRRADDPPPRISR
ncbi:type VII secretion-associated serine protease mycosin [Micromonospora sp. HM134]|uniref:type VII secretion-associated serine protease mycosin n=1 Tax=Micromonospora sp. HM134 TaxID=2583243 RepID=UPI001198551F|nr:type VII secretion-associated serine protease mycosin [Micromonospora sp. HM134]QDY11439.1 type VII secretion-associated serine protease mycosin [Micromonospora sp. HM134]